MRGYDLILKKRMGREFTKEEIDFLIEGYMSGAFPDYQMAALAMAVFFKGMTPRETADLTMAIVNSGEQVDLSAISGIKVDKHSTGGVGDKTTLILGPLVAAAGVPVAKMSGRGLGHTGGTIDKLEAIAGFKTSLTGKEFIDSVNTIKIAISGQTGNLAPADKKLYALRDVTATVDSVPLIASSVMSKKIASGADAIVLDVKTGSGAFMKSVDEAFVLARAMVEIGTRVGRQTVALITDMDQPLGKMVGNAVEVVEAVECLKGQGPADLQELCLTLGSHMVHLAGLSKYQEEAKYKLEKILFEGQALDKFREMIQNQQGDPGFIEDASKLPQVRETVAVLSPQEGYISGIDAEMIGIAAMSLGAGRQTKDASIDLAVGIKLDKKLGDLVSKGEQMATLYVNNKDNLDIAKELLLQAYSVNTISPNQRSLVLGVVTANNI